MAIFVYGTLRHPDLLPLVAGGEVRAVPARLDGHRVVRQADTRLPFLEVSGADRCEGLLLTGPTAAQRTRLDAYELPFGYRLRSVSVATDHGVVSAEAYFPDPGIAASGTLWSLDEWAMHDLGLTLVAAGEFDRTVEVLGPDVIGRNWHMILHRASARLRAASMEVPATLRRASEPGDVELIAERGLTGSFFRLAAVALRHLTFRGGRSAVLEREVLVGADAALVLPYDPVQDRVLLLEQFRSGPFVHGNPNPWTLEPVAGIVDAGETPEEAALRETGEEAGLTLSGLEPMFRMYASPGSTTDFFHCYVGLADLSQDQDRYGGLDSEGEDLRIHVLPFDDAMRLIETGEVNVGPLIAMLLWLSRARERLRASA